MPCHDDRTHEEKAARHHQAMTRMCCEYCTWLEQKVGRVPEYAQEWWKEHKELDRVRLAREEQEKRAGSIRRKALDKLSAEERDALGL